MKRILIAAVFLCSAAIVAADKHDEMQHYRQIEGKSAATVQDMVDLILMVRGDFAKFATETKRIDHARSERWIKDQKANDLLDRGTLAYAIMKNFNVTQGWLFLLTRLNRYALRDVQQAGILSLRFSQGNHVSGEQLIGAITAAENYQTEKEQWATHH